MPSGQLWKVTVYFTDEEPAIWDYYVVLAADDVEARKKAVKLAQEEKSNTPFELAYCEIERSYFLVA